MGQRYCDFPRLLGRARKTLLAREEQLVDGTSSTTTLPTGGSSSSTPPLSSQVSSDPSVLGVAKKHVKSWWGTVCTTHTHIHTHTHTRTHARTHARALTFILSVFFFFLSFTGGAKIPPTVPLSLWPAQTRKTQAVAVPPPPFAWSIHRRKRERGVDERTPKVAPFSKNERRLLARQRRSAPPPRCFSLSSYFKNSSRRWQQLHKSTPSCSSALLTRCSDDS